MTIKKTFIIEIHRADGRIDNLPYKAVSQMKAHANAMRDASNAGAYIGTAERRRRMRRYWREMNCLTFNSCRVSNTGKFIFQHKGKKRRGMKNYPTPKCGWRKMYSDQPLTYTVPFANTTSEFFEGWVASFADPIPTPAEAL